MKLLNEDSLGVVSFITHSDITSDNIDQSTTSHSPFQGPYAHIRSKLDYTYHSYYTPSRQNLQDNIIKELLNTTIITDKTNKRTCSTPQSHPWIVFTAGAMGAGKTHTVHYLASRSLFPLQSFVSVDPDNVRRHLPEYEEYVRDCPLEAGERTRKEAGYISEILTVVALEAGKNVLVDGSLRDWEWYREYFAVLRKEFETLRIAILHVRADKEAILQRVEKRSMETGRIVPRSRLEEAMEQVPRSVHILRPLTDFFCEFNNNSPELDKIEILTEGVSWSSFQSVWEQSCPVDTRKRRGVGFENLT
eukprot:CAMPEP_0172505254 /NCGR_PEP_ID=MMETSP1066-20121228/184888_1 /TAXON_ID=671091 /ORGANISM="Coscinodiscus wailesii, Strain CCMP2513" /LENGTH=304 /DNA_ID=CAMNT_0013281791 /DNA_START=226 /DNA_END=1137 /DNA_ORIENTATION=+